MTEKRFTTVELPKPNRWGIWYDGAYLSTYQVCILLNEYVDVKKENEQLKAYKQKVAKAFKVAIKETTLTEQTENSLRVISKILEVDLE